MKKILNLSFTFLIGYLLLTFIPLPFSSLCTPVVQAADTEKETSRAELNLDSKSLVIDSSFNVSVYNLSEGEKAYFKSSAVTIASVERTSSTEAVITGLKVGEATITVVIKDGYKLVDTLECAITVGPPAKSIVFTKPEVTIELGKRLTLKTIFKPNNAVAYPKYISDNKNIVTISSTGRITAKNTGDVYVYAKLSATKYDKCLIHVIEPRYE